MKNEHWIAVRVIQNGYLLDTNYDVRAHTYYINVKANTTFDLQYFLIPESDEHITVTSLDYNNDILQLVSTEYQTFTFKPVKTGITHVTIQTKKHSSGSPSEIRIIE